ncbi:hypothetical protein CBR_g41054 [Chara braunii]|uniref:Amidase domain-containing protein n=1 Tax=Chara braunii TaxID=69332 RepID=A0A388LV06_CHABU|nr:hypothetical protein CBR_g41054 [Chara braunii]|eukprot:GBG86150.1 hypothetical protein CBR_g41054 [Chara braunii]
MAPPITMPRCEDVDMSKAVFNVKETVAPRLVGRALRFFVWIWESRLFGPAVLNIMLRKNGIVEMLRRRNIPEEPTFVPCLPDDLATENGIMFVPPGTSPSDQVSSALDGLSERKFENRESLLGGQAWRRWTIRDYHNAYMKGKITPTEVAERLLRFCEQSRKEAIPMNFFTQINPDDVRRQAEQSTQRYKSGSPLSVLDGVPIAIKDEIDCLPYETTMGTTWMGRALPVQQDATCVARLRECGAIIAGKTNMHEIGMGTTGQNVHFGTPRNPYNTSRYTGGSSSGSAAVVSAGLVPAALGADAGGSIRIPASLCGVVGLKPTFGRVNAKNGSFHLVPSVCVTGPICGTVEDTLIMYAALAGKGPQDQPPSVLGTKPDRMLILPDLGPSYSAGMPAWGVLDGIRIGKYNQWFNLARSDIVEACESALQAFAKTYNGRVMDIVIPELAEMLNAHRVTIGCECRSAVNAHYEAGRRKDFSHEVRMTLVSFGGFNACDYLHAQQISLRLYGIQCDFAIRNSVISSWLIFLVIWYQSPFKLLRWLQRIGDLVLCSAKAWLHVVSDGLL